MNEGPVDLAVALPRDVWTVIDAHLDAWDDVCALAATCRRLHTVLHDPVWAARCRNPQYYVEDMLVDAVPANNVRMVAYVTSRAHAVARHVLEDALYCAGRCKNWPMLAVLESWGLSMKSLGEYFPTYISDWVYFAAILSGDVNWARRFAPPDEYHRLGLATIASNFAMQTRNRDMVEYVGTFTDRRTFHQCSETSL